MTLPFIQLPEKFNITNHMIDSHISKGNGQRTAILYKEKSLSYEDVYIGVNKVGNMLKNLGVLREQRVLILLPDCPEYIFTFYGAMKIGAVPVTASTMLKPKDYEYYLNDSRAVTLVVAEEFLNLVEDFLPVAPALKEVIVVGSEETNYQDFHQLLLAASSELEPTDTHRDDQAFWLYSSGTTGKPKGTIHLHHDLVYVANSFNQGVTNLTPEDRILSISKMFFSYGNTNSIFLPFLAGASVILMSDRPEPRIIYETIEKYQPTVYFGVPTSYASLLKAAEDGLSKDLSSIRLFISAGENLPLPIFEQWKKRFGTEILDGIGSTEAGYIFICNRPGQVKPGSSGQALPGYEIKLVDYNDQEVPVGSVGNLKVKGDGIASGYWNKHSQTKKAFVGEWLHTGDQFYSNEEGYYWFLGRSDDMIKAGGIWVSPIEVETAMLEHPQVKECAVIGFTDQDGLVKLGAYVALENGLSENEEITTNIKEFMKNKIASYKVPRRINYVTELPRNSTGKVMRFVLRDMA